MFRSFPGRPLLFASLLGLILPPATSWAVTTVEIPAPFNTQQTGTQSAANPFTNTVSILGTLPIATNGGGQYTGLVNISNNALILQATTESQALANYAMAAKAVAQGYNFNGGSGPFWTGEGINSSFAAIDQNPSDPGTQAALSIGVMLNDDGAADMPDGSGDPIWNTWDGTSVNQYSVLIAYTYKGDTDLEGKVTAFDVSTAINNFGSGTRWQDGSFDYQGAVSAFNVSTAINNFNVQTSGEYPYSTSFASPSASLGGGSVSVPEPSTWALALIGAFGLVVGSWVRSRRRQAA